MQIHELNNFTGTLGSGAYLAVDDGNDTGKLSTQQLLAATEARIDNIIAGPAPSAEEIVDARLGDDGVTYPSLGDAIRDQVGDLKSALMNYNYFSSAYADEKIAPNGQFVFYNAPIKAGTIVNAYFEQDDATKSFVVWFADDSGRSTGSETLLSSSSNKLSRYGYEVQSDWNGFLIWGMSTTQTTTHIDIVKRVSDLLARDNSEIVVAPSNASEMDKLKADYVCNGTNDRHVINNAIKRAKGVSGVVKLCRGDFYITGFDAVQLGGNQVYSAIYVQRDNSSEKGGVELIGDTYGKTKKVTIHVPASAFNSIEDYITPSVIHGGSKDGGYQGGWGFNVKNINIEIETNTRKCIAINYQYCFWGVVENCGLTVTGYGQDVVPTANLIGIRGWAGWSDGTIIGLKDVYCAGFYVGFQLGGEHVVCERLGTRFCYYGYTFGEYPAVSGVAQVHSITLINCCDEHSACLPKFCTSGNSSSRGAGFCEVDFISFNIELYPLITGTPVVKAQEDTPGGWCGRIDYTIENDENQNKSYLSFWDSGHGKFFHTTNMAQERIGTWGLRSLYAPNYMQLFFDTTFNKLCICIDPSTKKWVDTDGNIVPNYEG